MKFGAHVGPGTVLALLLTWAAIAAWRHGTFKLMWEAINGTVEVK